MFTGLQLLIIFANQGSTISAKTTICYLTATFGAGHDWYPSFQNL